jgi:hypothetical protein
MLVETKQMVPITRLQKELTQTVRKLSDSGNAVYIRACPKTRLVLCQALGKNVLQPFFH